MQLVIIRYGTWGAILAMAEEHGVIRPLSQRAEGDALAKLLCAKDPVAVAHAQIHPDWAVVPEVSVEKLPLVGSNTELWETLPPDASKAAAETSPRVRWLGSMQTEMVRPGYPIKITAAQAMQVQPSVQLVLVLSPEHHILGYTWALCLRSQASAVQVDASEACEPIITHCALGPVITLPEGRPSLEDMFLRLEIRRGKKSLLQHNLDLSADLLQPFEEHISWLAHLPPTGSTTATGLRYLILGTTGKPIDLAAQTTGKPAIGPLRSGDILEASATGLGSHQMQVV